MLTAALALAASQFSANHRLGDSDVLVPSTSVEGIFEAGLSAHTNHLALVGGWEGEDGPSQAFTSGPTGFSPSSVRSAYALTVSNSSGAGTAVAIVDAFHYKNAVRDFNKFSAQFGLPQETGDGSVLTQVFQDTRTPAASMGWNQEEALDIEWVHAIAPGAKIYLVEANSTSLADLLTTVQKASSLPGVRAVSMSWSSGEFGGQAGDDRYFTKPNVAFFASSGDNGGSTQWPAMSRNVIAVGGTSLKNSGGWLETAWSGSGGGVSRFSSLPPYQSHLPGLKGAMRNGPDISALADPRTGAAVYAPSNSSASTWQVFGGTSLACPISAAVYALSGHVAATSLDEHTTLYQNSGQFNDIVGGKAGSNSAVGGYDRATGLGSPHGIAGF